MSDVLTSTASIGEKEVSSAPVADSSKPQQGYDPTSELDSTGSSLGGSPNKFSLLQTTGILAGLIVLCCATYWSSLNFYLFCDDFMFLGYAHKVAQESGLAWLKDVFTTPMSEVQASQLVFRPLPVIWFFLDYKLLGLNVFGLHCVNLLMYSVTTSILFLLSRSIFAVAKSKAPTLIAFFVAALFAVHPLHVEVVPWITEQIDMLCTLLFVTSFLFFVNAFRDRKPSLPLYFLSLIFAVGSMLTKEHGVMLPAVLTVYYFTCRSSGTLFTRIKETVTEMSAFWAAFVLYLTFRFLALGTVTGGYFGQNADSVENLVWRWKNLHGFLQLLFPINLSLANWSDSIFVVLGVVYISIGAVAIAAARAKSVGQSNFAQPGWQSNSRPDKNLFFFLALWTVISAVPPLITWGLDKNLSGARHTYLLGIPFLMLVVGLFLSRVLPSAQSNKRLAIAGIAALTGLLSVFFCAALLNTQAWSRASVLMRNFQASVVAEVKRLPPGKKVALLYLPANLNGAHLFYHSQHAQAFQPPFYPEDLTDKIEFPIRTLFSHNANLANTTQMRDLAKRGYTFCYWDNNDSLLRTAKIDLAEQLNIPVQFVRTTSTEDDTKCRYIFKTENPDDYRRAEFIEFKARSNQKLDKRVKAQLTWDTKNDPGFVDLRLRTVVRRMKPTSQFSLFHLPVSESKDWLCSDHTGQIYIDVPRQVELDRESLRLIDGYKLVPKLSFAGTASTSRGIFELGDSDVCTLAFDANSIPGAQAVVLEVSRPSVAYESLLRSVRLTPAKFITAKQQKFKKTAGTITIPKTTFPKKAFYEFRLSVRGKDGKQVGYFSDPVSIVLKPARW